MSDIKIWKLLFPFRDPTRIKTPGHLTDEQVMQMHAQDGAHMQRDEDAIADISDDSIFGPTTLVEVTSAGPVTRL